MSNLKDKFNNFKNELFEPSSIDNPSITDSELANTITSYYFEISDLLNTKEPSYNPSEMVSRLIWLLYLQPNQKANLIDCNQQLSLLSAELRAIQKVIASPKPVTIEMAYPPKEWLTTYLSKETIQHFTDYYTKITTKIDFHLAQQTIDDVRHQAANKQSTIAKARLDNIVK